MPSLRAEQKSIVVSSSPRGDANGSRLAINNRACSVLVVVPTLDTGAADAGAVEIVRTLSAAGHRAIVAARAGRLVADVTTAGGEFVALDTAATHPWAMARTVAALVRIMRARQCVAVHALGRAPAWAAYVASRITGVPLITSAYKGFREQNLFKRFYNRVMVSGDRITAASEQIARILVERYGSATNGIAERISIVPLSVDLARFDPDKIRQDRVDALRRAWGVKPDTHVILVTGRILRRKGHHTAIAAARRLKERGLKDVLFVFVGEDRGRTHYTGEVWDLVLTTGTVDVVRMAAPVSDMAAAYAAATAVVSAAVQPEGLQRAIIEAQAMGRPVIVSDLAAGQDVVLSEPSCPAGRAAGLRFAAGNDEELAERILRVIAMPEAARRAMGERGRFWANEHFNAREVSRRILRLYDDATDGRISAAGRQAGQIGQMGQARRIG